MDSDKFSDPRNRSQRGRGRGRRGRGGGPTRGTGGGRGRGKGRVSQGAARATTRSQVAAQPEPEAVLTGDDNEGGGTSNAFRFEEYDALRASARRDGVKQDVDLYAEGRDDNYDNDDEGGRALQLDTQVADAENDEDGKEVEDMNMVGDFGDLARVLCRAPLWAKLGSGGQFTLGSEGLSLESLVESEEMKNRKMNDDEGNEDVKDMMKQLDMISMDGDDNEDQEQGSDSEDSMLGWLDGL